MTLADLVYAIVPTIGASPWLAACLAALRQDGGAQLRIVVVDQGAEPAHLPPGLSDRVLRLPQNTGFAQANNLALRAVLAASDPAFIATVNDDLIIVPGWTQSLLAGLAAYPQAAAAQGVQLQLGVEPARIDGCGLGWNRFGQAVQLGRDQPATPDLPNQPIREIFGVSATAAIFRRTALERAQLAPGEFFDSRLVSYYEDVDLAGRLRAQGFTALCVPAAQAHHAGSTSGQLRPEATWRWIYGNRYLVLARLLGRSFWPRLPWVFLRDAVDLCQALTRHERPRGRGILAGWTRAAAQLPGFAHTAAPLVSWLELRRFQDR